MNTTNLIGRICNDLELKYTQNGTANLNFTLAVNRNFTNQQGEREADFIKCVAWKKTAEVISQHMQKGSQLGIEGRLQTRNYENQQGQKVYVTEVVVNQITFIGSNNQNNGANQPFNQQGNVNTYQQQNNAQNGQYFGYGQPVDIPADDSPF